MIRHERLICVLNEDNACILYVYAMNEDNGMRDILCINVEKLNTDAAVNLFQSLIRVRTGVTL